MSNLPVINSQRGGVEIVTILHTGSKELSAKTVLDIKLKSQNPIPANSRLTILFPNNLVLLSEFKVQVNGVNETAVQNADSYIINVQLSSAGEQNFDVIIQEGLQNPPEGPYSLQGFSFEFQTESGAGIDFANNDDIFSVVNCEGFCSLCSPSLSDCTSCGADIFTQVVSYLSQN
jgi:hypothetical protein